MTTDRFGNPIDPNVGYARGSLLKSSADEVRRLRHAQAVTAEVVSKRGIESIGVFTGNPRYFPLLPEDLPTLCEEWVGPGLFSEELRQTAIRHLGGDGTEMAAVFNRTSAGIVATILALNGEGPVVSVVPDGDRSHASVIRGCKLSGVELIEVHESQNPSAAFAEHKPSLVVVTSVTSALARMSEDAIAASVRQAKAGGAVVLMDEAYGARLRPVLHEGAPSLSFGPDLVITNADKAGLSGPRAGIMAGRSEYLVAAFAKASEMGMEARAPIAAGALRSLQAFDPETLREEARDGAEISSKLASLFGDKIVCRSDLGPTIDEQDVMDIVLERSGTKEATLVPAEVTSIIGMLLLRDRGILTVNTHGQPGARVSFRLKPTAGAVEGAGGANALGAALESAIDQVCDNLDNANWLSAMIFGE